MSTIKPSSHGIVVDHKESGVRYATLDEHYDSKVHRKVRDLLPHESVTSYQPKPVPTSAGEEQETSQGSLSVAETTEEGTADPKGSPAPANDPQDGAAPKPAAPATTK